MLQIAARDMRTHSSGKHCRLPDADSVWTRRRFHAGEVHEEMATAIPGSRLVVIDECAHLLTMGQPKRVSAAMRLWLRGIKDQATAKVLPFRAGAAQDSPSSIIAPAEATASSA